MADPDAAVVALDRWRSLGVGVSIDDYGTGQSSLSYLQRMPATELKIDRSFIAAMAGDLRNLILVRSTIAMARELGLEVVAEGVEDEAALDLLRDMGCDQAQGCLISRPLRGEAVAAFAAGARYPSPRSAEERLRPQPARLVIAANAGIQLGVSAGFLRSRE